VIASGSEPWRLDVADERAMSRTGEAVVEAVARGHGGSE
jgi:hypothetical protein